MWVYPKYISMPKKVQKRTLDLLEMSNVGAWSQTQVLSEIEMPLLQPPSKKVFLNDSLGEN